MSYIPLSLPRRFICDLMHFARQVPTIPMQRRMNIINVAVAREKSISRPSWCAIFVKAFAIVCDRHDALRRSFISFPRPRLYQPAGTIASVAVAREYEGENCTFFTQVRSPEERSLKRIDDHLELCKSRPLTYGMFRRALFVSKFPTPLRRLMWWWGLNTSGARREKYFGTFGISVTASLGAAALFQWTPHGIALNYGVMDDRGNIDVRLMYDHRIWDGAFIAKMLEELETVLKEQIMFELRGDTREPSVKITSWRNR